MKLSNETIAALRREGAGVAGDSSGRAYARAFEELFDFYVNKGRNRFRLSWLTSLAMCLLVLWVVMPFVTVLTARYGLPDVLPDEVGSFGSNGFWVFLLSCLASLPPCLVVVFVARVIVRREGMALARKWVYHRLHELALLEAGQPCTRKLPLRMTERMGPPDEPTLYGYDPASRMIFGDSNDDWWGIDSYNNSDNW